MRLLQKIVFFFFIISCSKLQASKIDNGYKALFVYDYFKAKKIFYSNLNKNACAASFGLATIFYRNDNPFHQVDSAYKYSRLLVSTLNNLNKEERNVLAKKYAITDSSAASLCFKIDSLAFIQNSIKCNINSLEIFEAYINYHCNSIFHLKSLFMRDSVVFTYSKGINFSKHFNYILVSYPESFYKKEIEACIDKSNYLEFTKTRTPEMYFTFIQNFPKSHFLIDAQNEIYNYYSLNKDETGLYKFINSFPTNSNVTYAWKELYSIHVTEYSTANLSQFILQYPEFPFKETIEQDIKSHELILLPFEIKNSFGFIDTLGNIVINNDFESVDEFNEGLCVVEKNEKFGYINKAGKLTIPYDFDEAESFKNGLAIVKKGDQTFAIDHSGLAKSKMYDMMSDFNEDVSIVTLKQKSGVINKSGNIVVELQYDDISDFHNGIAVVHRKDKYGFINRNGEIIIPTVFDWVESYENNRARAKLNGKFGVIDNVGLWLIKPTYDRIDRHQNLFLGVTQVSYDLLNQNGCVLQSVNFPLQKNYTIKEITDGKYFKIISEDGQTLADTNGVKLVPNDIYVEMYFPSSKLIRCSNEDYFGFIDEKKNEIIKFIYDEAFDFISNSALVKKKDKWMLIDKRGKTIFSKKCSNAEQMGYNYYLFETDSSISILNDLGESKAEFLIQSVATVGSKLDFEFEFYNSSILSIIINKKKAFYSLTRKSYIWKEEGFLE